MGRKPGDTVQLNDTDFAILEILTEGRNVGVNLAERIEKSRGYINSRLPYLRDYGLVRKIGPADRSGLYELTRKGEVALEHQEEYQDTEIDFDALVQRELDDRDDGQEE